jgi:hypothetical protein
LRVEREVEWSDPRLPSTMVTVMNMDEHLADTDYALTWARVHRLDGPDGSWLATERGIMDRAGGDGLLVWTGEGAYAGLSAVLVGKETDMPGGTVYAGYIFEGDLPPFPEPPAE